MLQSVSVEEHTPTNHCNVYELFIVRAFDLRNWPSSVLSSQVLVLSMVWDLEMYHCRMARSCSRNNCGSCANTSSKSNSCSKLNMMKLKTNLVDRATA